MSGKRWQEHLDRVREAASDPSSPIRGAWRNLMLVFVLAGFLLIYMLVD